ncbi:MAG: hypothetical protein R3F43_16180 [bacterium]
MAIAPVLLVLAVALVGKHLPRRALAGAALVALGFGVMAAPRVLDLGVTGLLADGAALAAVLALALRLPTRLLPLATLAALAAGAVLACAAWRGWRCRRASAVRGRPGGGRSGILLLDQPVRGCEPGRGSCAPCPASPCCWARWPCCRRARGAPGWGLCAGLRPLRPAAVARGLRGAGALAGLGGGWPGPGRRAGRRGGGPRPRWRPWASWAR